MARYIDIDKYSKWIDDINIDKPCVIANVNGNDINCPNAGCAECYYNNGGAEDIAPAVHSRWETSYFEDGYKVNMTCLNCGEHFSADYNDAKHYNCCPNCGAKMDSEPTYSYEEKIELYKQMETLEKLCGEDYRERLENYWERLEKWEE